LVRSDKKLDASRPCHAKSGAERGGNKKGRVIKKHDNYLEKHRIQKPTNEVMKVFMALSP
jgi:hypothetical protein